MRRIGRFSCRFLAWAKASSLRKNEGDAMSEPRANAPSIEPRRPTLGSASRRSMATGWRFLQAELEATPLQRLTGTGNSAAQNGKREAPTERVRVTHGNRRKCSHLIAFPFEILSPPVL